MKNRFLFLVFSILVIADHLAAIRRHLTHNPRSIVREYDSLNHLFQHCTPATAMNYGGIEQTISPQKNCPG